VHTIHHLHDRPKDFEFLLTIIRWIPVCDKAASANYRTCFPHGAGESRFIEQKLHVESSNVAVVFFDAPRCILCYDASDLR